jgi:hypothetical protein
MDPVTTVIVAASSQLAIGIVKDLYEQLKAAIISKYGKKNSVQKAIEEYELKPESAGRVKVLEEEIEFHKVNQDTEILAVVDQLSKVLKQSSRDNSQVNVQINDSTVQGIIGTSNLHAGDIKIDNTNKSNN